MCIKLPPHGLFAGIVLDITVKLEQLTDYDT